MKPRALVVDDSLTVRMDIASALEGAGFEVALATNLLEARAALGRGTDVVILDVVLPDGDGVDLLAEIRRSGASSELPVMLLSSEAEVRDRIRGLERGASAYVGKPYDRAYVIARAKELLPKAEAAGLADASTVLVIDDSVTFREELRAVIESDGYRVVTAGTGEDGLRIAAEIRPAAIVVDGVLPGIDGAAVVRRIRLDSVLRGTPCLLLTASQDKGAELRALDSGADAFVRKDEDFSVVRARLAALVRRSPTRSREDAQSLSAPKRILAVDDSATYLGGLSDVLRGAGYEVMVARSGEDALALLAVDSVDCILLDLIMPGMGGEEACRRIKMAPAVCDTPLIMLTALEDREAVLRGLSAGADDFIAKSADFEVLKARVLAQIRRKQFEDEHRQIRERLLRQEAEAIEAKANRVLAETRAALLLDLENKNREIEAFSYTVSHDLRAPLRAIDGFSQALADEYGAKLDETAQDYLRRVRAAAQRMGDLIDAILILSRVGRAELRRETLDLGALARAIVSQLSALDPARDVELEASDGMIVQGDARLLRGVLENLLGNAWKFTAGRAPARIEIGVVRDKSPPEYFVRDNGAGFDMAQGHKLFAPFQRLHSVSEFAGTGVGLATVQRIIDRHGGRVWAEGRVNEGASFFFTLPARPSRAPDG